MKNINKIFALIICSALALSLIGCSGDKAKNNNSSSETKNEKIDAKSEDQDKEDTSSSEETSSKKYEMTKKKCLGKWNFYYPECAVNVNNQCSGYGYVNEDNIPLFYFYAYAFNNTDGADLSSLTIDEMRTLVDEDLLKNHIRRYFYSQFNSITFYTKDVTVEPANIDGVDAYWVRGQIGDGEKMNESAFTALYVLDDEVPYVIWCSYFYHSLEEDHDTWIIEDIAPSTDVMEEFAVELQSTFEVDVDWQG